MAHRQRVGDLAASLTEDGLALGMVWLAVSKPVVFAVALLLLLSAAGVAIWVFLRFLRMGLARIRARFG